MHQISHGLPFPNPSFRNRNMSWDHPASDFGLYKPSKTFLGLLPQLRRVDGDGVPGRIGSQCQCQNRFVFPWEVFDIGIILCNPLQRKYSGHQIWQEKYQAHRSILIHIMVLFLCVMFCNVMFHFIAWVSHPNINLTSRNSRTIHSTTHLTTEENNCIQRMILFHVHSKSSAIRVSFQRICVFVKRLQNSSKTRASPSDNIPKPYPTGATCLQNTSLGYTSVYVNDPEAICNNILKYHILPQVDGNE